MNNLTKLNDFERLLTDYRISPEAQQILESTKLVLLTGSSASGRNTVINELVRSGKYHFIVSDTTRSPRSNNGVMEKNGVEYWFRTEQEMLDELREGMLLEAEIIHGRQVSGISIRELKKASQSQKVAIDEVDIGGITNVLAAKPDTIAVLMLPPSFDEWQRRLRARGEMSDSEYLGRLQTALRIFRLARQDMALKPVINDTIAGTALEIDKLVTDPSYQSTDRQTADALLQELEARTVEQIERYS